MRRTVSFFGRSPLLSTVLTFFSRWSGFSELGNDENATAGAELGADGGRGVGA